MANLLRKFKTAVVVVGLLCGAVTLMAQVTPIPSRSVLNTLTVLGQAKFADGTAAAPSLAFASQTNTGLYLRTAGALDVSVAGTFTAEFNANAYTMGSAGLIQWTSGTPSGSADIALKRIAAGQLGLQKDSTHGVTLDVGTDTKLNLYGRDGSTYAALQMARLDATLGAFSQNIQLGAAYDIEFNGRARLSSISTTSFNLQAQDNAHGVNLNVATDATLKLFARDGSSAATLDMGTGVLKAAAYINSATGYFGFSSRTIFRSAVDGTLTISDQNESAGIGVRLNVLTANTLKIFATDGTSNATLQVANITATALVSSSGTRYICTNTTGVFSASASACSGTEPLIADFTKDGYHIPTIAEYADLRQQIAMLTAEVAALKAQLAR